MTKRRILPWAVLAVCYLFTIATVALYGAHNIDSDMSSEMVLAQLLNEEHAFLSPNWLYSTELRVVSPVPVYQLGLVLFPDSWHMARTFAMALLLAGVAASFIYMGRGAGLRDSAVYAAGLILLPVSEVHRFLFSFGGFYTMYTIFACLLVGLTLRMGRGQGRVPRAILLAALGFFCGLSGVRMPMICGAPLMLACAWTLAGALRRESTLREVCRSEEMAIAAGAGLSTAAMLAGYLVNTRVFERMYAFTSYHDLTWTAPSLSALAEQVRDVLGFFGVNAGTGPLSLSAVVDLLMLGVCVLMAVALCALIARRASLSVGQRVLTAFAALAPALGMLVNMALGVRDNPYAVGYYMLGVFMLVPLLMLGVERACRTRGLRTAAMLAVCAVFLLESGSFVRSHVRKEETEHEEAARWLVENGYTAGFSSFWHGNVLTEASDGALELYVYRSWKDGELYPWLQRAEHLRALPDGPVFVYVNSEDYYTHDIPCAREDHLVYHSERFDSRIYAYDSAREVARLQVGHEGGGAGIE